MARSLLDLRSFLDRLLRCFNFFTAWPFG